MMPKKNVVFICYNLYKGGSLRLFHSINRELFKNNIIDIFSPVYPIKFFNNLWRVFLDQFIVPVLFFNCSKLVMFGNVPSIFFFGIQTVLIHNPNYWRLDWRYLSLRNRFEYYYFLLCNKFAEKFLHVRYVTQIDSVKADFLTLFPNAVVDTIGSPFNVDEFQVLINSASNFLLDAKFKNLGDYLYYPAYFYESKNHKLLDSAASLIKSKYNINIVCSNKGNCSNLIGFSNISFLENLCLLINCKGLIFPSEYETFGYPLIEAWYLKKPIIALNRGYVNSLLDNVYFHENDVESLINSIKLFSNDLQNGSLKIPKLKINIEPKEFIGKLLSF